MNRLALASLLILSGCVIQEPAKPVPPRECPAQGRTPITPKPVWPDSCVADWYAQAKLPPCVEDYFQDVKSQQEKIAKKKVKG